MAEGDITKVVEYSQIEVKSKWNVHVRKTTKIMEEQADGSKTEISRSHHRHVLQPFLSKYNMSDKSWTHTATDISGENAKVQGICNVAWDDDVKNEFKTYTESQPPY